MTHKINFSFVDMQPVLETSNMEETLEFYSTKLGFNIDFKWSPEEGGPITHAGLSLGDASHDSEEKNHIHLQLTKSEQPILSSGWIYINMGKEIVDIYNSYKENGVDITSEMSLRPWQMVEFHFKDCNGHAFRFAYNPIEGGELDF